MDQNDLNRAIIEAVNSKWAEHKKPLLLSQLGAAKGGQIGVLAKTLSSSLRKYIEDNLSSEIEIIRDSKRHQLIAALPRKEGEKLRAQNHELAGLLEETARPVEQDRRIRFRRDIWWAFRKPREEGLKRIAKHGDILRIEAVPESQTLEDDETLIDSKFIASSPQVSDSDVYQSILSWCQESGVAVNTLSYRDDAPNDGKKSSKSVLHVLMNALSDDDLRRLNFPLDVIRKLQNTRG